MEKNQLIVASIISLIIFFYSLELTSFSGYTFLGLIVMSVVLYFGYEHILTMLSSGKSMVAIICFILVAVITLVLIWGGYKIYINKKEINKRWTEYKCRPYILPFAGWAIGPKSVTATSNFSECMWNTNKSMFDILMTPFRDILNQITQILSGIVKDIQNIRKMINYLRDSMEEIARDIYRKIWSSYLRIAKLFKIFLKVFEKLGQVFVELFDVMLYTVYTFGSLFNGVVGKIEDIVEFFCFDENTMININGGDRKKIKDITTGDILEGNNRVTGIIKFDASNVKMYNYNDIIVSGDHLVMENNKWLRVKDSDISKEIDNYNNSVIYCLITENSLIKIGDNLFKDYVETNNNFIKKQVYSYIINNLNKNNELYISENINLESGLDGNLKILMENGTFKKLKDINIGEITNYGKVLSVSKIKSNNVCKYNNMIMTNNIIIYKDDKWIPLFMENIENIDYEDDLYHIITECHNININGINMRDFEQISDKNVNNIIDNYVLSNL